MTGNVYINYNPTNVSVTGSPKVAAFEFWGSEEAFLTLESGFVPPPDQPYIVIPYRGNQVFAKPGDGATLQSSWFFSTDYAIGKTDNGELQVVSPAIRVTDSKNVRIGAYGSADLARAVAMAEKNDGSTITLYGDVTLDQTLNVTAGNVTLDLNGKTITSSASTLIKTSGTANLTIDDTAGGMITADGTGAFSDSAYGVYHGSTGTLTIDGFVKITGPNSSSSAFGVYNYTTGTVVIQGSYYLSNSSQIRAGNSTGSSSFGVYNNGTGSVAIKEYVKAYGGTAAKWSVGVSNNSTGTVTIGSNCVIEGGSSSNNGSYGVWVYGNAPITLDWSYTSSFNGVSAGFRVNSSNSNAYLKWACNRKFSNVPTVLLIAADSDSTVPATGVFAKPADDNSSLSSSYFNCAAAYTNHTVQWTDGNLEIVENTN